MVERFSGHFLTICAPKSIKLIGRAKEEAHRLSICYWIKATSRTEPAPPELFITIKSTTLPNTRMSRAG